MKTLIILLACIASLAGCNSEYDQQSEKPTFTWGLQVVEVDSCQYVLYKDDGRSSVAMVHHNNCKYCRERRSSILVDTWGTNGETSDQSLNAPAGSVKLGGTLIRNTEINPSAYTIAVDNSGLLSFFDSLGNVIENPVSGKSKVVLNKY